MEIRSDYVGKDRSVHKIKMKQCLMDSKQVRSLSMTPGSRGRLKVLFPRKCKCKTNVEHCLTFLYLNFCPVN